MLAVLRSAPRLRAVSRLNTLTLDDASIIRLECAMDEIVEANCAERFSSVGNNPF